MCQRLGKVGKYLFWTENTPKPTNAIICRRIIKLLNEIAGVAAQIKNAVITVMKCNLPEGC